MTEPPVARSSLRLVLALGLLLLVATAVVFAVCPRYSLAQSPDEPATEKDAASADEKPDRAEVEAEADATAVADEANADITDAADEGAAATEVLVNVFAGSERSRVEMRLGGGPWRTMQRTPRADPLFEAVVARVEAKGWWFRRSKPTNSTKYIFVKDPDGYDIEILQRK